MLTFIKISNNTSNDIIVTITKKRKFETQNSVKLTNKIKVIVSQKVDVIESTIQKQALLYERNLISEQQKENRQIRQAKKRSFFAKHKKQN